MIKVLNKIEFENMIYKVVEDNEMTENHCDRCQFNEKCGDYCIKEHWFACDATFHANKIYLIKDD